MGNFADETVVPRLKALVIADSGGGKTGACASLIDAGFKLRFLDFDGNMGVLRHYVKKKELLRNVSFVTLRDSFEQHQNGGIRPKRADSFMRALSLMKHWRDGEEDLGPIHTWGPDTFLVVDTLNWMGRCALNHVLMSDGPAQGKPGSPQVKWGQPTQAQFGIAQGMIEKFLVQLFAKENQCNVLVNTHVRREYVSGEKDSDLPRLIAEGAEFGAGKALMPLIPTLFENTISLQRQGDGRRVFKTKSAGLLSLKTVAPAQAEYPIDTGLVDLAKLAGVPMPKAV